MSRSYNKEPFLRNFMTHGRASEKKDKKCWHKKFRRVTKQICQDNKDDTEFVSNDIPVENEIANVCKFSKDGKKYIGKKDLQCLRDELNLKMTRDLKVRK